MIRRACLSSTMVLAVLPVTLLAQERVQRRPAVVPSLLPQYTKPVADAVSYIDRNWVGAETVLVIPEASKPREVRAYREVAEASDVRALSEAEVVEGCDALACDYAGLNAVFVGSINVADAALTVEVVVAGGHGHIVEFTENRGVWRLNCFRSSTTRECHSSLS